VRQTRRRDYEARDYNLSASHDLGMRLPDVNFGLKRFAIEARCRRCGTTRGRVQEAQLCNMRLLTDAISNNYAAPTIHVPYD
jgi:hypothetical protein